MTIRMIITTFCLCLASACVQETGPLDSDEQLFMNEDEAIVETSRGYQIAMPADAADTLPTGRDIELTVELPDGHSSSVLGRIERSRTGSVTLVTSESLALPLGVRGTFATLSEPRAAHGCGAAEHGIDCFAETYITACAGTVYCLPGDGPGGFSCRCV